MRGPPPELAAPARMLELASRLALVTNVVATGVLLGILQWSTFFLLQSYIASTAIIYLLATTVWLLGSLLGMLLPGRPEALWLGGSLAAFYGLRALATANPYDLSYLPLLLLLVAGMGAYAGNFFRRRARAFGSAKWLFFLENTGFVAGILLTTIALYYSGAAFFGIAPAVAAGIVCASGARMLFHSSDPR